MEKADYRRLLSAFSRELGDKTMAVRKFTRLIIVNESEFLRVGLRTLIESVEDIKVVGDFSPDDEVVARVRELEPDVVLIGLWRPVMEGVAACRRVLESVPTTRVITLTSTGSEEELIASMMSGASGCIPSAAPITELVRAVRVAQNGGLYFNWGETERTLVKIQKVNDAESISHTSSLSDREIRILSLIGAGYSNEEIGVRLHLATATIRNNITMIRSKLNLHSRAKLIAYAARVRLDRNTRDTK